jgi:hypothetical protein
VTTWSRLRLRELKPKSQHAGAPGLWQVRTQHVAVGLRLKAVTALEAGAGMEKVATGGHNKRAPEQEPV